MKKSKQILFLLFIGIYSFSFAQNEINFNEQITELNALGKEILASEDDDGKYAANIKYKAALKDLISNEGTFEYNFKDLKTTCSVLQAHNLKIYNPVIFTIIRQKTVINLKRRTKII